MASEALAEPAVLDPPMPDPTATDPAKPDGDGGAMVSISGQVRYLSTGDRAALRRMYLTRSRAVDGVVVKLLLGAKLSPRDYQSDYDRWKLIAHVAATLSGTGAVQAHAAGRRLGAALHAAGYSENRLLRLTAARGQALIDQVVRAVHMLAQGGQAPVNLWTLYHLVGNDPVQAEAARLRIAQDYYAAEARSGEGTPK